MKPPQPLTYDPQQPLSRLMPALEAVRQACAASAGVLKLSDGDTDGVVTIGHAESPWLATVEGAAAGDDVIRRPCRVFAGPIPQSSVEADAPDADGACPDERLQVRVRVRRYLREADMPNRRKSGAFLAFLDCVGGLPYDLVEALMVRSDGADVKRCQLVNVGHSDPEEDAGVAPFIDARLLVEFASPGLEGGE